MFERSATGIGRGVLAIIWVSVLSPLTALAQPAPPEEPPVIEVPVPDEVPEREPAEPPEPPATDPESPPPETTPPAAPDTPAPPTPEELAEIQAALAEDAGATDPESGADVPAAVETEPAGPSTSFAAQAAAFLPDIALILDVALAAFSDEDNLQTGGHDPTVTGFNLQQLELSMGKSVDPYFRFDSNLVFSQFGVELEEAYATTLSMPWSLQARVGQMLTRFGRINSTHPHAWSFADQPFYWGRVFGGEGNRGLGAELSALLPLPWYVEVLVSTTQADGESTARSFYGAENRGVSSPLDFENLVAIKQFFDLTDNLSLLVGASAANGPNSSGRDTRTDLYGLDLYLKYRPIDRASHTVVSLQLETILRRRQIAEDVLTDAGGYAELLWRFVQRWAVAGRYEAATPTYDSDRERAVDPLDPEHTDYRQRCSTSLTFWPTEFSRVRLQGSTDLPAWREQPIWAGFLTLEVVVGTHGSHAF